MSRPKTMIKRTNRATGPSSQEGLLGGCDVAVFGSDLGWMVAVRSDLKLVRLSFGYQSRDAVMKAFAGKAYAGNVSFGDGAEIANYQTVDDWSDGLVGRLRAFAAGSPELFDDISLEMSAFTRFQRRVVAGCRRIGFGETLSYGQLAVRSGHRGAARAVGQVMANNRFPIVVPCHRVVGASGRLGGFSAPDGIRMKLRLLRSEGVEI